MKTKLNTFVKYYLAFLALGVILQACCNNDFAIIDSGNYEVLDLSTSNFYRNGEQAIVTGEFTVYLVPLTQIAQNDLGVNFITSSYATSCDYAVINGLDYSTLNVYFNKSFSYQGETVTANTNLTAIEELMIEQNDEIRFSINFTETLLSQAEFQDEIYRLKVEIQTSDDISLEYEINLKFEF